MSAQVAERVGKCTRVEKERERAEKEREGEKKMRSQKREKEENSGEWRCRDINSKRTGLFSLYFSSRARKRRLTKRVCVCCE